jgi:hypothetical protein
MIEHNIQDVNPIESYPLLGEKYLRQRAAKLDISSTEIRCINYCRLYLNVLSIADITKPDGKYIRAYISQARNVLKWRGKSPLRYN